MKKLLQSLFILLFIAATAFGQERTITGTVTSKEDGQPLPGVSVKIKGTSGGTTTSAAGKFSINVSAGSTTIEFSSLGYAPESRQIGSSNLINISLSSDSKTLSDVVVVGYGTVKRKDVTGSVGSVSGAVLASAPVASFDQALAGRVTGVQVTVSNGILGSTPRIRIRGTNSISNGSDPLYVVDGLPIVTGNQSSVTATNPLGDINPNDIQSVDVLKDGAATAIYGSRAAGGVIIITTKKGVSGKPKVNYNSWFSSSNASKRFSLLSGSEFVTIANEKLTNSGAAVGAVDNGTNTNWQDVVFREDAFQQNQALSFSGATDQSNYYFSLNYADYDGIIKANNQNKYQFFGKLEQKALNNHVTFGASANINYTRNFGLQTSTNGLSGNVGNAIRALPNSTPFNADGSYNFSADLARLGKGPNIREIDDNYTNIQFVLDNNIFRNQSVNLIGGTFININILPGLDVKSQLSTNASYGEDYQYYSPLHGDGRGSGGYAFQQFIPSFRYVWTNTVSYNKVLGDHTIGVTAGLEFQKSRYRSFNASGTGISSIFFGGENIISSSFPQATFSIGGGVAENAYKSYFVRGTYGYKERYLLSGTFRTDKISSLPIGNQVANLPGASIAWRVSKEEFFANASGLKFINDFKIRGGYAKVGNTDIGNYPFAGTFAASTYGAQSGLYYSQAGNSSLKFETSKKYNVGVDLSLFNSRINITADYFKNNVDNLILFAPTAPSLGVPGNGINQNVGKMTNKGYEFSVNTVNFKNDNFSWSTDVNLTLVKNKITQLANNNADVIQASGYNINRVGESIGSLYGYQYAGVNSANGNPLYEKANGQIIQGNIANQAYYLYDPNNPGTLGAASTLAATDKRVLGSTNPTYYGGINNTVSYKSFDLSIYLVFSGGNKIMNITRQESLLNQKFLNNGSEILNRWTPTNTSTSVPKVYYGRDAFTNLTANTVSRFVEDGKFIRGQNINLGYTLPTTLINKLYLSRVRIYGQVQNAFVITNYSGLDPELNTSVTTNSQAGLDYNTNPKSRTFVVGINVGF
ncbi:SusC/RagA family TonB-linked outer membrane protein [Pedobacter mendelii]|uniref:SusC/RagA family TonB-linked outer membrane protein n=1 Tax=Pedobacter mendelii TaxID=1908240 RepID=A0ABQ2BLE6_9SPHI|nr:TonB-dependent receptor [Pedobacter mendelii]GGI28934.1 SusC/RagA family TonB-linked outer membrane protein [Pedobacter mendelii]